MEKIKQIQNIIPENGKILVRTHGKFQWFIHYYLIDETGRTKKSIYKVYIDTDKLDAELDKIIEIIKGEK